MILDERVRNDSYASCYRNNDAGVHGGFSNDDRLPAKSVVVGLIIGHTARAYPLALAEQQPVINDRLDETPVLVTFGSDGKTGIVFDRRLDGRTLTFDPRPNEPDAMVDRETDSSWQRLTGRALSGPMRGRELTQQTATTSFWFGWHDFFCETTVFDLDSPGSAGWEPGSDGYRRDWSERA